MWRATLAGEYKPMESTRRNQNRRKSEEMHIAIITAGGAGMFCGSCMHDNTWARALMAAGAEVSLIPTYTPIRVDEDNVN